MNNPYSNLLKHHAFINGEWVSSSTAETLLITNPATQAEIGRVPSLTQEQVIFAIQSAKQALALWKCKTADQRGKILLNWHGLILENLEPLAQILTAEQGKSLKEARHEIQYGADFIQWFAEEGKRAYGDVIPSPQANKRFIVLKEPIGVVAAITPWNFPNATITRKIAPAIAAGCTVIVKPSELTPFSALALAELAMRAGLPSGVLNVVTGKPEVIGTVLTEHPEIKKLSFTGSTRVGKWLMKQCAGTLKKLSLELGGHAPFMVFADANIDQAVQGVMASKFRNSGQTCVCTNRIYVAHSIHDIFVAKLAKSVAALTVAPGNYPECDQGPLITPAAVHKVETHIRDALTKGATLLTGGKRHALGGQFFEPTLLTGITHDMLICQEETFGPVAAVIAFRDDDEAQLLQLANHPDAGLAAYCYTRDVSRVWRMAEGLEYGMVGINTGLISSPVAPFGGIKESGFGREGSKYGLDEYLTTKLLCLGID